MSHKASPLGPVEFEFVLVKFCADIYLLQGTEPLIVYGLAQNIRSVYDVAITITKESFISEQVCNNSVS